MQYEAPFWHLIVRVGSLVLMQGGPILFCSHHFILNSWLNIPGFSPILQAQAGVRLYGPCLWLIYWTTPSDAGQTVQPCVSGIEKYRIVSWLCSLIEWRTVYNVWV